MKISFTHHEAERILAEYLKTKYQGFVGDGQKIETSGLAYSGIEIIISDSKEDAE